MKQADFELYQKLLLERSGLSLTPEKIYLLKTRLEPLALKLGLSHLSDLTALLRDKPADVVIRAVVQAMTTNETSFFRDLKPYDHLKEKIFPALLKKNAGAKAVRLWSAACSTGQEPYSIAIAANEFFRSHPGWTVQIVATDISEEVLAQAREGVYSQFEIQRGLTMKLILENFTQEKTQWKIREELKRMVKFSSFNLLEPMAGLGNFDVIFCRNVLIYFDVETKKKVLHRLADRLQPPGYLLLGACETTMGLTVRLKPGADMPGVHVLAGGAPEGRQP